jgi:hypothetical protein
MSPEAQRIAIAEACGWVNQGRRKGVPALNHRWVHPDETPVDESGLPDYLNDLNAMRAAEKALSQRRYWEYADIHLKAVVWKDGAPGTAYQCATAAQRAEAFLRTIGQWQATGGEKS